MNKRIVIFCHGQLGDCLTISSVLKYKNELWGRDSKIIWFIEERNKDLLKYQDIELRDFPRGFGYPEMAEEENKRLREEGKEPIWEDWQPLVDENNHLNIELAKSYPSLQEFDLGYFPAPHQMTPQQRHGIPYPLISKKVFDIPNDWLWHPVIKFSNEERHIANHYLSNMGDKKLIAIETYAGSGQSILNDEQVRKSMEICNGILGQCNFLFVSHKYLNGNEKFPVDFVVNDNIYFADGFTVRQCALLVEQANLLISVSSGITVASSAWGLNATPIIQYTGSEICATKEIALGKFELVTHDGKTLMVAQNEYYEKLNKILNYIK